MSTHASRPPFSLDALVAEAKRRMRRRRALGAAVLLLLGGITAAAVIVASSPGSQGPGGPSGGGPGAPRSAGPSGRQASATPFHGIGAAQHPRTTADRLDPSAVASILAENELQKQTSHLGSGLLEPRSARLLRQLPSGARVYVAAATGRQLCVLVERMRHLGGNVKPGAPLWECTSPLTRNEPVAINGFRAFKGPHKASPAVSWGAALDGVSAVSFTAGSRLITVPVEHNAWVYRGRYLAGRDFTAHFENGRTQTIP